ncbi:hypothetical protein A9995_04425 [Erythrobacter sp. QSSC1-22B]|nr:hypothetical protein A9995_04425 [Erythrobacter sp. QSSC1-22B]
MVGTTGAKPELATLPPAAGSKPRMRNPVLVRKVTFSGSIASTIPPGVASPMLTGITCPSGPAIKATDSLAGIAAKIARSVNALSLPSTAISLAVPNGDRAMSGAILPAPDNPGGKGETTGASLA